MNYEVTIRYNLAFVWRTNIQPDFNNINFAYNTTSEPRGYLPPLRLLYSQEGDAISLIFVNVILFSMFFRVFSMYFRVFSMFKNCFQKQKFQSSPQAFPHDLRDINTLSEHYSINLVIMRVVKIGSITSSFNYSLFMAQFCATNWSLHGTHFTCDPLSYDPRLFPIGEKRYC